MPIRIRLTLAFSLAMAAVLAATGFFLYARLGSALDSEIDQGLRSRAVDVAALEQQADAGLRQARTRREGFAQVLDWRGRVYDQTPGFAEEAMLAAARLARARQGPSFFAASVDGQAVRLFAMPIRAEGRRLVAIVGTPLEGRRNALVGLRNELVVGGPIVLLLASLVGYALAAAALRPVERMRRRAADISTAESGQRLPVAGPRDEITRLGETLNGMLERLEVALERERSFVADASHELRTPLALLKTEIELALEEPHSAAALRSALQSVGEETDRLTQLAEALLLLARIDKGLLPIRSAATEIGDLLAGIALRFERRATGAGRRIEAGAPAGSTVLGDRLQLEQALGNLVDNALRHGAGTIRLGAAERDGHVELHVMDGGQGFPQDFIDHAFERFSRAGDARGRAGTGLGLAIVAEIARAHGGTAHAANRPGGGADVHLSLPREPPEPAER